MFPKQSVKMALLTSMTTVVQRWASPANYNRPTIVIEMQNCAWNLQMNSSRKVINTDEYPRLFGMQQKASRAKDRIRRELLIVSELA
jgi:hypothetical protein